MTSGQLIILNGASSAGKSSILHVLQDTLTEPYLECGIDKFLWMLPERYLNRPLWYEIIATQHPPNRDLYFTSNPLGDQLIYGMHRAIAALVQTGNNVLVDHVLIERHWLTDCVEQLAGFTPLFVGVLCPLELLERREHDRKDRTLGQARAHETVVHAHGIYDLEVDTSLNSPEACAQQIRAYLDGGILPSAFARLHKDGGRGITSAQ
jgi:chloramphenicol 3-O phosphotransferase